MFQLVRPKPSASGDGVSASIAPMISRKSIAILSFTDLSPKRNQESFSDGMAEEILDALATSRT